MIRRSGMRWSGAAASRCGGRSPTRSAFDIASGDFEDAALPPELTLAARFGVNRHTVRERHRGTGAGRRAARRARPRHLHRSSASASPIRSARAPAFRTGLEGQARERRGMLLAHSANRPTARIARRWIASRARPSSGLETLSEADGRPLSRATSYFDARRFAGIERPMRDAVRSPRPFAFGIDDYLRHSTVMSARHADAADLADLRLSPGAIVLVTVDVNVDPDGGRCSIAKPASPPIWSNFR